MNVLTSSRALVLCAHTDDEFGCAGTIVRLVESGAEVHYLALSRCEESVPLGFEADCLEKECRASAAVLGIDERNVQVEGFRVRHFPAMRQEILEHFVRLRKEYRPDLVLLPTSSDMHQDHATVFAEGFRAFKTSSVLGYELPQNLIEFANTAFVHLSDKQLDRKISALSCYRSQEFRPYAAATFIRALAHVRGVQSGNSYAEAFEVLRVIV